MDENYTHIIIVLDSSGSMSSILQDTIGGFNTFLNKQKEEPSKATLTQIHFSSGKHSGVRVFNKTKVESGFLGYNQPYIWNAVQPQNIVAGDCVQGLPPLGWGSLTQETVSVPYAVLNDFSDIKSVQQLSTSTFVPGGGTPLLDVIAIAIDDTGKTLEAMPEAVRPAKVLFVIITDGEENASKMYKYSDIEAKIKHQTEVYKWTFSYLGANQNAIAEASKMGVNINNALTYGTNKLGVTSTFGMLAKKTATLRSAAIGSALYSSSMNYSSDERVVAMGEGNATYVANSNNVVFTAGQHSVVAPDASVSPALPLTQGGEGVIPVTYTDQDSATLNINAP